VHPLPVQKVRLAPPRFPGKSRHSIAGSGGGEGGRRSGRPLPRPLRRSCIRYSPPENGGPPRSKNEISSEVGTACRPNKRLGAKLRSPENTQPAASFGPKSVVNAVAALAAEFVVRRPEWGLFLHQPPVAPRRKLVCRSPVMLLAHRDIVSRALFHRAADPKDHPAPARVSAPSEVAFIFVPVNYLRGREPPVALPLGRSWKLKTGASRFMDS